MLAEFRDYLKTLDVASHYYIGKLDNTKMEAVGIYGQGGGTARREAIGRHSSYDIAMVRILVHWNKDANESEAAARNLYEAIRYITHTDMCTIHVEYLDLLEAEPTFIGTDDNNVYEYHITARIYYRR